jgi:hypothetical protein
MELLNSFQTPAFAKALKLVKNYLIVIFKQASSGVIV